MLGAGAYPWMQHYGRSGKPFSEPEAMARTVACPGIVLWEGFLPETEEQARELGEAAAATGLRCVSSYANARLHEADGWRGTGDNLLRSVEWVLPLGLSVLVVNPEPISWRAADADKDDAQLRTQAAAMDTLGERLRGVGVTLAYHTHHMEMRQAAREFHHTLRATDPENVALCLDAHWVYRGAGDSHVALEDIVGMYADRVRSVHLRQSVGGVWSETFTASGDIDYGWIADTLRGVGFSGPVVLEQAREAATPETISVDDALRQSADEAARLFTVTNGVRI